MRNIIDRIIISSNLYCSFLIISIFCISNILHILSLITIFYEKFFTEIKIFSIFIFAQILGVFTLILSIIIFLTLVLYIILKLKSFYANLKTIFICVSYSMFPLIILNIIYSIVLTYFYTNYNVSEISFINFFKNISNFSLEISNNIFFKVLRYIFYFKSMLLLIYFMKRYKCIFMENYNENTY